MSKRSAKEKLESKSDPVMEEIYSPSLAKEDRDCCGKSHKSSGKNPKKESVNWSAILLILMFSIPAIFGAYFTVMDYLNPEAAQLRKIQQPLEKCYNAANPEKVADIDHIMRKYKGREQKLFAQLRTKYGKIHQECEIYPPQ